MKLKGKLLKCDRCGATIFLKYLKTNDIDGGYDSYDVYEDEPKGWNHIHDVGDVCPTCYEEYRLWLAEFKGTAPKE